MIKGKVKLVTTESNNFDKLEKKHIEYLIGACTSLSTKCSKKELKVAELKCQPHYTTVFRQIKTQLESILKFYQNLDTILSNEYLLMTKNEMFLSFSEFYKFVTEEAAVIGRPNAISRKKFFNCIVHFQFLALELIAYFPTGAYNAKRVTITKHEPKIWWEKHFPNKTFVQRKDFMSELRKQFCFNNEAEAKSFENCIDFTKTRYVTVFEFDMITRLYFPWEQFIPIWSIIYNHPGYLHFGTYGETKDILSQHLGRPGTYIFRASCKDLGFWTIGYVKSSNEMGQVKVDKSSLIDALIDGRRKKIYLYPNGESHDPDLSVYRTKRQEVFIDSEQLALYASFNEFKECKICRVNEKDVMIESCGHEICETCFKALISHSRKCCPFCNQLMKSHTKIVHQTKPEEKESIYVESSGGKDSAEGPDNENSVNTLDKRPANQETSNVSPEVKRPELPKRPQILSRAGGQLLNFNQPTVKQPVQNNDVSKSNIVNKAPNIPGPISDDLEDDTYASMNLNDFEIIATDDKKVNVESSSPITSIGSLNNVVGSTSSHNSTSITQPVSAPTLDRTPVATPAPKPMTTTPIPGPYPSSVKLHEPITNGALCSNNADQENNVDIDDGMYATFEEEQTEEQTSPIITDKRSINQPTNSIDTLEQSQTLSKPQITPEFKPALPPGPNAPIVPPFPSNINRNYEVSEIYADFDDISQENGTPSISSNGSGKPSMDFSKWTKSVVEKAMKIARFNEEIALDILKEYC